MIKTISLPLIIVAGIFLGCRQHDEAVKKNETDTTKNKPVENKGSKTIADAATILARKEVPVLCYHQIRDWNGGDSKSARDIIVPVNLFKAHLKILADSGYHTILPDQLYDYLVTGAPLPDKPFMLT